MNNKIYSIGIDPGLKGAIAFIDLHIEKSKVIPMPEARPWLCPVPNSDKNAFYKVGNKKGQRKFESHRKWGCNIVFHDDVIDSICSLNLPLNNIQSYIEDPSAQGVGRAGLNNSKTVGLNTYPLIRSMKTLTGNMPWAITTQEWQSHPAIATYGKLDWGKGATNKKEAKKHDAVIAANRISNMNIPFEQDGLADALLIGLYGALKYPPVVAVDATEASLILEGYTSVLPIPSSLPFTEALIYARRGSSEQEGIIGRVALSSIDIKEGGINEYAVSDRQFFSPVPFDMMGQAIRPYYDQPLG